MIEQFYKAYNNTLEMLVIRKYITNEDKANYIYPIKDFILKKHNDITQLDIRGVFTPDGKPVVVLFIEEDLKNYRTTGMLSEFLLNRISEDELNNCYIICIYQSKDDDNNTEIITTLNIKKERQMLMEKKTIQLLQMSLIAIDRFNNSIMPEIKLLSKDEPIDFAKSSMSIITLSDAITRYYGAMPGDIFQFYRKMSTGPNISWRQVRTVFG
jgi:DNA-directed RNA polymerase subunit H (RpoH/RPB5)